MKVRSIFFGGIVCVALFHCRENPVNGSAAIETDKVPISHRDTVSSTQSLLDQTGSLLNLEHIQQGFNGLQIRVWGSARDIPKERLVVLTQKDMSWSADVYYITYPHVQEGNLRFDSVAHKKLPDPKSGWPIFSFNLAKLGIRNLPTVMNIPGYLDDQTTNDYGYHFEIADTSGYRMYMYTEPQNHKQFDEAIRVTKILDLIDYELA